MPDQAKPKTKMARRFRGYLPVIVDVETAGFNAKTDALLEIAAVTVTFNEQGLLVPHQSIDRAVIPFEGANLEQSALEFTGIDPHDPEREAHDERNAMGEVLKLIRQAVKAEGCTRAVLVGHNAHFDHAFVTAATERCSIKRNPFHPFSNFDTATLSGLAYGQTVLAKTCAAAGIEFSNSEAHSALYDAQKTAELFCNIVNKWKDLGGWQDEPEEPEPEIYNPFGDS